MTERPWCRIDGELLVLCDACEKFVPSTQQDQAFLPDNGVILRLVGWYGGFFDSIDAIDPEEAKEPYNQDLVLCHDCALKVWRMFPALRALRGMHPTVGDEPCCEFHWTFGRDESGEVDRTIYGDGTSRKHKGHRHDPDAPLVRERANPWENLPD